MLDFTGKFLEKIIDTSLKTICEFNGLLTANQYGFRCGKSTIDEITQVKRAVNEGLELKYMVGILLLDVNNVFNSAPWQVIANSPQSKDVPDYICRILDDYDEM